MTFKIPQPFATNDDYAAGPDVGTPTKIDPESPGDGFVRGTAAAAQHINHMFNGVAGAGARAIAATALCLRRVTQDGETIDDTSDFIAAACRGPGHRIVAIKVNTNGVMTLGDADHFQLGGTVPSITDARAAAVNLSAGRILVVGSGGNRCAFSDNSGSSWTAGGDIGETRDAVTYDAVNGFFLAAASGDASVRRSTNGVAWADVAVGATYGRGIGVTDAGIAIVVGADVYASDDGGATWATVGDLGFSTTGGSCAGAGGSVVMAASGTLGGADLNLFVSTSADGITWAEVAEFEPPAGLTFVAASSRVLADACNPEAFVVLVELSSGVYACYLTADAGATWTQPTYVQDSELTQFAFAGGKLIYTEVAALFASDGIGHPTT